MVELDQAEEHPTEILNAASDPGYAGIMITKSYGGMGAGAVELSIIVVDLSAALRPVAGTLSLHLDV